MGANTKEETLGRMKTRADEAETAGNRASEIPKAVRVVILAILPIPCRSFYHLPILLKGHG